MTFFPRLVLLCACLALAACDRSYTYRYRLTVTAVVAGKSRTASSVVEVTETSGRTIDSPYINPVFEGDMPVIALGDGRVLAVAFDEPVSYDRRARPSNLAGWGTTIFLLRKYGLAWDWKHDDSGIAGLAAIRKPIALAPEELPALVLFRDPNDSASQIHVDATDLSATLGPGARIAHAEIAVTADPPTHDAQKVLHWLVSERRTRGCPDPARDGFCSARSFSRQ